MKRNSRVGNDHFKCWLKQLDPVSRVQKMSAVSDDSIGIMMLDQ